MKRFSGSAISRHQLFTLADGSFVVQWDDKRVQDILTGQYREFEHRRDFGHAITDYELKQLKANARVEHYNRNYVWLYALPENGRFSHQAKTLGRGDRIRAYYLSTALPKSQISNVQNILNTTGLADRLQLRLRNNMIVMLNADSDPFRTLDEAEGAHALVFEHAGALFTDLSIAFLELDPNAAARTFYAPEDPETLNLDELIASQVDTTITAGRQVVLVSNREEECEAFSTLFENMEMDVRIAETARDALEILEDTRPELLVMDLNLPDMHGWQFLSKVKEIGLLRNLSILVVADDPSIGATVVRVEYLRRPVSIARLRHNIWKILHERIVRPLR